MGDIWVALPQFRKSPDFAITVVLTMALGIGANTAIFTLVHATLMKSLPVADPKTLYRVGDLDDCCVNGGFINDNGDFDLFSYRSSQTLQASRTICAVTTPSAYAASCRRACRSRGNAIVVTFISASGVSLRRSSLGRFMPQV